MPPTDTDIYPGQHNNYAEIFGSISVVGNFTQQLIYSFTSTVSFKDTDSKIDSSLSLSYKVILTVDDKGYVSVRIDGDSFITKDKSRLDFSSSTPYAQMTGRYLSEAINMNISGKVRVPNFRVEE